MKRTPAQLAFLCLLLISGVAHAASQDIASIGKVVKDFVIRQTINSPGEVSVVVGDIDPKLSLPACPALEPFLAQGSRLWGNSTVGVKCPGKWTVYIPVKVRVMAQVVVSAKPLSQGMTIGPTDIQLRKVDITSASPGILIDSNDAMGKTLSTSVPSGYPLNSGMLRSPTVIRAGQSVKLVSKGQGFQVSSSGIAIGSASEGQIVQVRTPSGQIVSGTARAGSIVEVTF